MVLVIRLFVVPDVRFPSGLMANLMAFYLYTLSADLLDFNRLTGPVAFGFPFRMTVSLEFHDRRVYWKLSGRVLLKIAEIQSSRIL